MQGTVVKIHSDFYYVKTNEVIVECKIRELLKKEKQEVLVGDKVEFDLINAESNQGAIFNVLTRKNHIPKPSIANLDQLVIVAAVDEPHLDFEQLNRYLTQAKIFNIPALICINKDDLEDRDNAIKQTREIYSPLGYEVVFTSALTGDGIDELLEKLVGKISAFSGASGVGKSSLLNKINPNLNLRTKNISAKSNRGVHTTRHSEIIEIDYKDKKIHIADTPGFSFLKFDNILPKDIGGYFDEISSCSKYCQFSDCLHLEEVNCNVLKNIETIHSTRYESYTAFVKEAFEYKQKLANEGYKKESKTKKVDVGNNEKATLLKVSARKREKAKNHSRQNLKNISSLEDAYYNTNEDWE